jgi:hypothetical protein
MIETIPIRDRKAPRLDFGQGRYYRQCIGSTYERITQGGTHIEYVEAEDVVLESSIAAEVFKQRGYAR